MRLPVGGKAESVQKLSLADLKAYHAQCFVPQNMVVAVFGDIEPFPNPGRTRS